MAKFLRPFFLLVRIVLRPCGVDIRALNPETFSTEYRLLFESVCFVIINIWVLIFIKLTILISHK